MAIGTNGTRTGTRPTQKPRSPLGDRIVTARLKAGLTQKDVAEQSGASQRAVAHWETNSVALRADQLAALADVLGVTVDYLMGREDAKPQKSVASGKVRRVFEEVSTLPRHQQEEVVKFVTRFVKGYQQAGSG